jgi:hypothetical protein
MKMTVKIPVRRPVCRTPIKPVQRHKKASSYNRQSKHKGNHNDDE